jgi:ElaB/YqjD/DUF883 family membrane-anchored ribosome-binding protein
MTDLDMKQSGNLIAEPRKMADALSRGGERLGEKMDTFNDRARDVYAKGKERAEVLGSDLGAYIKEQPGRSVLIAAGVGLVLGAILVRRR